MKTRLTQMIEILGWHGGTVHQVNREIELLLGYELNTIDILSMSDVYFWEIQLDCMSVKSSDLWNL
jgi:hypothetical protein